jgi:hypothetical protein
MPRMVIATITLGIKLEIYNFSHPSLIIIVLYKCVETIKKPVTKRRLNTCMVSILPSPNKKNKKFMKE